MKPTQTVSWAESAVATDVVEPPEGKADVGFFANERPSSQYTNWLLKTLGLWSQYLDAGLLDGDHEVVGNFEVTGLTTLVNVTVNEVTAEAVVANVVIQTPSLEADAAQLDAATITALTISAEPKHPAFNRRVWLQPWSAQLSDGTNSSAADCNASGDTAVISGNTLVFPLDSFRAGTLQALNWYVTAAPGSTYTVRVKSKSGATPATGFTASGSFSSGYQAIANDVSTSSISCDQMLWVEVAVTAGNVTFHGMVVEFKQV